MAKYNYFDDNFTRFQTVETPKVTMKMPLAENGEISLPWASGISSNGTPIVKDNVQTPKMIVDNNPEQEYIQNNPQKQTYSTTNKDLKGNKKTAYEFFISKGLQPYQAAGIVGNLMGESNLNHKAVNPSSKAYGIAQWLGSRKKKLFAKYGNDPSFEQQLEFVWEELNGEEKNAFNRLLQTQSVEEATNSFMKHFERPSQREMAQSINNRIKYAKSLVV